MFMIFILLYTVRINLWKLNLQQIDQAMQYERPVTELT